MSQDALKRISDRTISERELRSEINNIEGMTEPPSFWIDIANDATYSAGHRAVCICQFFKRQIRKPVDLLDLARLLNDPNWINPNTVTAVTHLKGEIPVQWNPGERVLAVRLFPGEVERSPVLYLRLSRPLAAEDFVRIMRAPQSDATAVGVSVLEAACGE
jgi:hypothetical protein